MHFVHTAEPLVQFRFEGNGAELWPHLEGGGQERVELAEGGLVQKVLVRVLPFGRLVAGLLRKEEDGPQTTKRVNVISERESKN